MVIPCPAQSEFGPGLVAVNMRMNLKSNSGGVRGGGEWGSPFVSNGNVAVPPNKRGLK